MRAIISLIFLILTFDHVRGGGGGGCGKAPKRASSWMDRKVPRDGIIATDDFNFLGYDFRCNPDPDRFWQDRREDIASFKRLNKKQLFHPFVPDGPAPKWFDFYYEMRMRDLPGNTKLTASYKKQRFNSVNAPLSLPGENGYTAVDNRNGGVNILFWTCSVFTSQQEVLAGAVGAARLNFEANLSPFLCTQLNTQFNKIDKRKLSQLYCPENPRDIPAGQSNRIIKIVPAVRRTLAGCYARYGRDFRTKYVYGGLNKSGRLLYT